MSEPDIVAEALRVIEAASIEVNRKAVFLTRANALLSDFTEVLTKLNAELEQARLETGADVRVFAMGVVHVHPTEEEGDRDGV